MDVVGHVILKCELQLSNYNYNKFRNDTMEDNNIKREYDHVIDEIEFDNIRESLSRCNLSKISNSHYAIHEFKLLPTIIIKNQTDFLSKTAFLVYHYEIYDRAHQSLIEALSGHYNSAYTLLRNTFELIINSAFWECLAHKKYRNRLKAETRGNNKTLRGIIEDKIQEGSGMIIKLELLSASVYDIIDEAEKSKKEFYTPHFKGKIDQLVEWNIFSPWNKEKAKNVLYNEIYDILSKNVHVRLPYIDIGRRILNEGEIFETKIVPSELDDYLNFLHKIMDISICLELNILKNLIINNLEVKNELKDKIETLHDLNLDFATNTMEFLTEPIT